MKLRELLRNFVFFFLSNGHSTHQFSLPRLPATPWSPSCLITGSSKECQMRRTYKRHSDAQVSK